MDSRLDHVWTDSRSSWESYAADETVRAPIARARVGEMLARGWRLASPAKESPAEETVVWMEGPAPDGRPQPIANPLAAVIARAWDRAATREAEEPFSVAA